MGKLWCGLHNLFGRDEKGASKISNPVWDGCICRRCFTSFNGLGFGRCFKRYDDAAEFVRFGMAEQ